MNQRIKKLWIKALRSGKYKQGKFQLRKPNGQALFCCLGVLCDLHARTKQGNDWDESRYDGNSIELPKSVVEWAGLDSDNPKLGRTKYATSLNDEGYDFSFIATRIEKYL